MTTMSPDAAAARKKSSSVNHKYAAFVIDANTGQILFERYADKSLHPASLTKIMTLLLVFEAIDQGKISLRDRVHISSNAASKPPSKIGLKPGSTIRVQDAIYALVTKSANDIATALAEHVGGSESRFAAMMTERARTLGMTRTTFRNASGLHDPRQVSSARDMAKLARYVIVNYPDYYRYFSTKNFSYAGQNYHNHNGLMKTYKGMDGMKTGYINPSGFNLVASAVRDNRRVIGVVFGGRSAQSRNAHMANLLDDAFATLKKQSGVTMASANGAAYMAPVPQNLVESSHEPIPAPPRKPGILVAANALDKIAPAIGNAKNKALPALLPPTENLPVEQGSAEDLPAADDSGAAWAIQIGAYSSRAATDQALHESMKKLPVKYASLNPIIAPLKTDEGWLFRARLQGLSRHDAFKACNYLSECVPVAPKNN